VASDCFWNHFFVYLFFLPFTYSSAIILTHESLEGLCLVGWLIIFSPHIALLIPFLILMEASDQVAGWELSCQPESFHHSMTDKVLQKRLSAFGIQLF